jgi:hypothetical protein
MILLALQPERAIKSVICEANVNPLLAALTILSA